MEKLNSRRSGQSLVEYLVVLAMVAIIVITVVAGIGQRSQGRFARASEALDEAAVASRTPATSKPKPTEDGIVAKPPN